MNGFWFGGGGMLRGWVAGWLKFDYFVGCRWLLLVVVVVVVVVLSRAVLRVVRVLL